MTYEKMRILFIGTVDFSLKALETLINNNYNIVGLITKNESKFNSDFADLTPIALTNKIPHIYREKNNEEDLVTFIKEKNPHIVYCFGWSHILPNTILSIPSYGVVGFHPAELPNNRGRHPIIWALFLGLKTTASSFFLMDEGVDTGDLISQEKIDIDECDTARTLYTKITTRALEQILSFSKKLEQEKGKIIIKRQNINQGNIWRKRSKKDGKIDFRMSTEAILNLIKALTFPYVGAHIEYLNDEVKVWNAREENFSGQNIEPGKVISADNNELVVKTYDGAIRILEHNFTNVPLKGDYL